MQTLNFLNLSKKHKELSKYVILYNMAIDLEGEEALSYAIKYHLLKEINELNKKLKSDEVKNFIKGILEILYREK